MSRVLVAFSFGILVVQQTAHIFYLIFGILILEQVYFTAKNLDHFLLPVCLCFSIKSDKIQFAVY